jgi:hypothetical protein
MKRPGEDVFVLVPATTETTAYADLVILIEYVLISTVHHKSETLYFF